MLATGTRVQLHSATDEWMRGDRYGEVVGYGRLTTYRDRNGTILRVRPYRVKLDKSGKVRRFHPEAFWEVFPALLTQNGGLTDDTTK